MTLSNRYNSRPRGVRAGGQSPLELFSELEQLFQPWNELSRGSVGVYHPIDLYETDEAVVLEMAVPGVNVEDLDLSIEGRQVTIRGRTREDESDGRRYWARSMPRGEFSRTVTVPSGIDASAIEASVDRGVLTLTMPKAPEAVARRIAVTGGSGRRQMDTIETSRAGTGQQDAGTEREETVGRL